MLQQLDQQSVRYQSFLYLCRCMRYTDDLIHETYESEKHLMFQSNKANQKISLVLTL